MRCSVPEQQFLTKKSSILIETNNVMQTPLVNFGKQTYMSNDMLTILIYVNWYDKIITLNQ